VKTKILWICNWLCSQSKIKNYLRLWIPIWVSIMEHVVMNFDRNYSVFLRKHNRNRGNNWIIPIGIYSDLFHEVLGMGTQPKYVWAQIYVYIIRIERERKKDRCWMILSQENLKSKQLKSPSDLVTLQLATQLITMRVVYLSCCFLDHKRGIKGEELVYDTDTKADQPYALINC